MFQQGWESWELAINFSIKTPWNMINHLPYETILQMVKKSVILLMVNGDYITNNG